MTIAPTKPKLTAEQRAALAAHDRSVSLAAGAGCGKTFVLTERFVSHLDPQVFDPVADLHELVAITFTDAAAREMRDRVRKRCYERLQQATDETERQSWRRLLRVLDGARISTIHSFCAALLRNHAVEADLDPRFEQLDQPTADLLRLRTLDDRLRQLLLERNEQVLQLATRFGLSRLREYLAHLLGENLDPVIEQWGSKSADDLVAAWKAHFACNTRAMIISDFLDSDAVRTLEVLCASNRTGPPELCELFDKLLAMLADLRNSTQTNQLLDELRGLAKVNTGPARKKNWIDEREYVRFMEACKSLRELIDKSPLKRPWSEEHLREAAQTGLNLLAVAADISSCYQLAKAQRGVLEFDDLIQKTYRLLTDSRFADVQRRLAKGTRLLLVDEFQDTDPLQVRIVQAFCGEQWQQQGLFVVGDFKQSIYRFRGAEPEVSRSFRKSLPKESQLSLTTNFRSQGAILDFVNALFCDSFEGEFEPLRPERPQVTPTPSVEFLWAWGDTTQPDTTIPAQFTGIKRQRYLEARCIAKRLAQLIDSEQPLIVDQTQNTLRGVRQGDIAILLRALSDVHIYEAALREQDLDYYLAGGHAFYAQQEIYDVLHLLRAVISVADDLSLAGALRSPIFSLTDETLFWLVNHSGSLNAALFAESLPDELTDEERSKVINAGNVLQALRAAKDQLLVAELVNRAIELTGYDAVLLTEFLGERKLANLHKLVEQARALDRLNPGDLSGFVTQLGEFVTRAPKEPIAATSASGDVIRVMTIHNAKGLEFPLVVVPDLNRKGNMPEYRPVMDETLGPLVPVQGDEKVCVGWNLYQIAQRHDEQLEKLRLLYVACTRAADYLILSSSLDDPDKPNSDWLKFLAERFDLVTGACRATLPPGYDTPQIKVTSSEPVSSRKPKPHARGVDLIKLIEKTQSLAAAGKGMMPGGVVAISSRSESRRRFSFSRLSGVLMAATNREPNALAGEDIINVESESPEASRPPLRSGARGSELDPRGFGTLVHALLERVRLDNPASVREVCEFLAPRHLESPTEQAIQEATAIVEQFLNGPRAEGMLRAKCLLREPEFILPWSDAGDHYLQGYIDTLYQDSAGEWHLIDYKSNRSMAESVPALAAEYELQMFVYALACERTVGKRPVEATVCFLRPNVEHSFKWTSAQEAALTNKLDDAIRKILSGETLASS